MQSHDLDSSPTATARSVLFHETPVPALSSSLQTSTSSCCERFNFNQVETLRDSTFFFVRYLLWEMENEQRLIVSSRKKGKKGLLEHQDSINFSTYKGKDI